jgi:transposase
VAKAKRRRFTAEYKRKILHEADSCTEPGSIGALLRREGLYSSHLVEWRKLRERGELAGLEPKKRGPKAKEPNPLAKQLAEKERENARLKAENAKLQLICELQKKVSPSWA